MDHYHYWLNEQRKSETFFGQYSAFINYYHSGARHNDDVWFRRGLPENPSHRHRMYNLNSATSCPYDWHAAMTIAHGLYKDYIREQLAFL
jgi:hypothetical protein